MIEYGCIMKSKPDQSSYDDLLTPDEAARLKGVTRGAIYAAVAEGRLPHIKILSRIALRHADVLAWTPVHYRGRLGRKGGRPEGLPTSEETRARLSQAMKQSWARRKQTKEEESAPKEPSSNRNREQK